MVSFSGNWLSTFGRMELTQQGNHVSGVYVSGDAHCLIDGEVVNGRLNFTYQEPAVRGEGWFELIRNGNAFSGQWHPDGALGSADWTGERIGFDGLWNSDFGLLRL